jgi:hypothetical protein
MSHPLEENAARQIVDFLELEPRIRYRENWLFELMKDHWDLEEFVAGLEYAENQRLIDRAFGRVTLRKAIG